MITSFIKIHETQKMNASSLQAEVIESDYLQRGKRNDLLNLIETATESFSERPLDDFL